MLCAIRGMIIVLINRTSTYGSKLLVTKLHSEEIHIQKVLLPINCFFVFFFFFFSMLAEICITLYSLFFKL